MSLSKIYDYIFYPATYYNTVDLYPMSSDDTCGYCLGPMNVPTPSARIEKKGESDSDVQVDDIGEKIDIDVLGHKGNFEGIHAYHRKCLEEQVKAIRTNPLVTTLSCALCHKKISENSLQSTEKPEKLSLERFFRFSLRPVKPIIGESGKKLKTRICTELQFIDNELLVGAEITAVARAICTVMGYEPIKFLDASGLMAASLGFWTAVRPFVNLYMKNTKSEADTFALRFHDNDFKGMVGAVASTLYKTPFRGAFIAVSGGAGIYVSALIALFARGIFASNNFAELSFVEDVLVGAVTFSVLGMMRRHIKVLREEIQPA